MRQNTRIIALMWAITAAALAGCPSPPEASPGGGGGKVGAPPPGGPGGGGGGGGAPAAAPPGGGDAPAGGGAAAGGGGGGMGNPSGNNIGMPAFKDRITGDAITLKVTVKGGTKGQIDFMQLGDPPTALHVEAYDGEGPFEIRAPAKLDGDVYVVAMNYANGTTVGPKDDVGTLKKPIELEGKDLSLEIKIGDEASWFERPTDAQPAPTNLPGGGGPGAGGPGGGATPPPEGGATPPPGGGTPPDGGAGGDAPPPGGDAGEAPK